MQMWWLRDFSLYNRPIHPARRKMISCLDISASWRICGLKQTQLHPNGFAFCAPFVGGRKMLCKVLLSDRQKYSAGMQQSRSVQESVGELEKFLPSREKTTTTARKTLTTTAATFTADANRMKFPDVLPHPFISAVGFPTCSKAVTSTWAVTFLCPVGPNVHKNSPV